MISARPIFVTIALFGLLAVPSTLLLFACGISPGTHAVPQLLTESVRPGGRWFAALTQPTSHPNVPDTNFTGYPDDQEQRMNAPGSPVNGAITLSKVMATDISGYKDTKQFGHIVAEQRAGKTMYWAESSQKAYLFPDSSPDHPHTLSYTRVERFRSIDYTDAELKQQRIDRHKEILEALRQYRQADVKLELDTAWANGDKEFVGVMADGMYVPGITDDDQQTFRVGVKVIPNTSDCPGSAEESAFQRIANRFAQAYNKLLLKRLQQQNEDGSRPGKP